MKMSSLRVFLKKPYFLLLLSDNFGWRLTEAAEKRIRDLDERVVLIEQNGAQLFVTVEEARALEKAAVVESAYCVERVPPGVRVVDKG